MLQLQLDHQVVAGMDAVRVFVVDLHLDLVGQTNLQRPGLQNKY